MTHINPDEPEWAHLVQFMREVRAKARGYADYWDWRIDRGRTEKQAAEVLQNFLLRNGEQVSGSLRNISDDPPDIELITKDGRRIGIEVTELVDREAVRRHHNFKQRGEETGYDWADWTPFTVAREICHLVSLKDSKLANATRDFDELLVAIVTDEGMIDEACAQQAAALCEPTAKFIGRAYFLLSYMPQTDLDIYPDGCPVLPIAVKR